MAIEFQCSGCNRRFSVAPEKAGSRAKCKTCGQVLTVPSPAVHLKRVAPPQRQRQTVATSNALDDLLGEAIAEAANAKALYIPQAQLEQTTPVKKKRRRSGPSAWSYVFWLFPGFVSFALSISMWLYAICTTSDMTLWTQNTLIFKFSAFWTVKVYLSCLFYMRESYFGRIIGGAAAAVALGW